MQTFYNTTNLAGAQLKDAVARASNQDAAILLIYSTGKAYSPSLIYDCCQRAGHNWPITSIRRSITNLTKDKKLAMTGEKVIGMYGQPENKWIKI